MLAWAKACLSSATWRAMWAVNVLKTLLSVVRAPATGIASKTAENKIVQADTISRSRIAKV